MTFDLWWLAYPVLGAAVGFFAGLLGVGGGGIMVPMLTTFFLAQGFPQSQVVTWRSALDGGHRADLGVQPACAPRAWSGALGTWCARSRPASSSAPSPPLSSPRVSNVPLAIFFAVFMAYVSIQMLPNIKPQAFTRSPGHSA